MSVTNGIPTVPRYEPAAPTTEDLDYANLAVIDLGETATAEGRAALAVKVREALSTQGFFYVVNHGYTSAQTQRMFDIADIPFSQASDAEKKKYEAQMKQQGTYQGYKLRNYWHIAGGVRDQIEHYNIHRDVTMREHPEALRPYIPEIQEFTKHNHSNVLHPLLRVFALGLNLPEETFVDMHGFSADGDTWLRFMKYYPRSEDDETKSKNVWLKGHTDFGSVTILYSQPVSALQIMSPDGKWRWVRHMDNAIVINAGDALEFLSAGIYPATRHRVVQPPQDQRGCARLGVFYFALTDDDVKLNSLVDSTAVHDRFVSTENALTMGSWRKERVKAYGQKELQSREDGSGIEEEVINGVLMRHYN